MTDLAHTNAGFIQVEETAFRRAIDRQVHQKFGKDINYLKDQSDTANALATSIFAQTSQITVGSGGFTTDVNGNFASTVATSANGKNIVAAFANVIIAGFSSPYPLIIIDGSVESPLWSLTGKQVPNYQGNYPLIQGQISGASLYLQVTNGTIVSGKSTPIWAGFTGGNLYWTFIYPT